MTQIGTIAKKKEKRIWRDGTNAIKLHVGGRLGENAKSEWSKDEETMVYWETNWGPQKMEVKGGDEDRKVEGRVRWEMRVTIRDKNSVNMLDMSLAGPTLALEETMKHIMGSVSDDGWRPGWSVSPLNTRSSAGTNGLGPARITRDLM